MPSKSFRITHSAFVGLVDNLLAAKRDQVWEDQRALLTVAALKAIRQGGHGFTWANTTLRMYEGVRNDTND